MVDEEPFVLLRSALEAATTITYFMGLSHMRIADLTAIFLSTPLIIIAAAALFLRQKAGLQGWAAVITGFIGVVLIVKPGTSGFTVYALLPLIAAFCAASRDLITRRIDPMISSLIVCFAAGIANMILGFTVSAAEFAKQPPGLDDLASWQIWLMLLIAAIVVTFGNYGVILACRTSNIAAVSPFRYSSLIWAMLAGFIVWHQIPDLTALAGSGLIIGSGLYLLHRERAGRRKLHPAIG